MDGGILGARSGRINPLQRAAPREGTAISHDTWMHRVVRVAVRPLVDTPISPNHLTTLRGATALAAALGVAVGSSPWQHVGAAAFVVSILLDRADGELARLSGRVSRGGHLYDLVMDGTANVLIFAALGIGLSDGVLGIWAIALGLVAGMAVSTVLYLTLRIEARQGERAGAVPGFGGFDPDDAMLAVPFAIWVGGSVPLLVTAAIGAPAFAAVFFWCQRAKLLTGARVERDR